jgi:hypothetical protein
MVEIPSLKQLAGNKVASTISREVASFVEDDSKYIKYSLNQYEINRIGEINDLLKFFTDNSITIPLELLGVLAMTRCDDLQELKEVNRLYNSNKIPPNHILHHQLLVELQESIHKCFRKVRRKIFTLNAIKFESCYNIIHNVSSPSYLGFAKEYCDELCKLRVEVTNFIDDITSSSYNESCYSITCLYNLLNNEIPSDEYELKNIENMLDGAKRERIKNNNNPVSLSS